jgi:hypothetical protein
LPIFVKIYFISSVTNLNSPTSVILDDDDDDEQPEINQSNQEENNER